VIDVAGQSVGTLVSITELNITSAEVMSLYAIVQDKQGFFLTVNLFDGTIQPYAPLYFSNGNCSGLWYTRLRLPPNFAFAATVVASSGSGTYLWKQTCSGNPVTVYSMTPAGQTNCASFISTASDYCLAEIAEGSFPFFVGPLTVRPAL